MKIAIIGYKENTHNYEAFFSRLPANPVTTLAVEHLSSFDAVILPGGGDITPAFFGERNSGSRNIDTELDILQFQALDYALKNKIPVLGICKGIQVINVALGGTIIQDLPTAGLHSRQDEDQYHTTRIAKDSFLFRLYGEEMTVNSAHHQGIGRLGQGLRAIQRCPEDNCIEAVVHTDLPVWGLQWHPERLNERQAGVSTVPLLHFFKKAFYAGHAE